jgi:hypothetical protein
MGGITIDCNQWREVLQYRLKVRLPTSVGQSALVSDTHLGFATNISPFLIIFRQLRIC